MSDFRQDFLKFALAQNVLKFGEFTTKAGRQSPYFFNAGLFRDGASTLALARFYARAVLESGIKFDMLFGPAYKGIVLAAATAMPPASTTASSTVSPPNPPSRTSPLLRHTL